MSDNHHCRHFGLKSKRVHIIFASLFRCVAVAIYSGISGALWALNGVLGGAPAEIKFGVCLLLNLVSSEDDFYDIRKIVFTEFG